MRLGLRVSAIRPNSLSDRILALLIIGTILLHRLFLWSLFGRTISQVVDANPDWLTWQFLPFPAYVQHFWTSLKYLQQTPPLPHLILGILASLGLHLTDVDRSLILLQFVITALTSALLFQLLVKIACPRWVATGMALFFGLSTDLFLFEINSFGQLFYESAAMLFGTALAVCLCGDAGPASSPMTRRHLVLAGFCAGLGILTRASFCYLALPVALAVERRWRWRGALTFLVPILLMQGTWCLKAALIYHDFTLSTSSWSGINNANGFNVAAGHGSPDEYDSEPFVASILASPDRYPAWLLNILRQQGYADWDTTSARDFMDTSIRNQEEAIQRAMQGTNPFSNSITIRLLSDQYSRAALRYIFESPWHELQKIGLGYQLFWQPIADYSGMFMGPIYVRFTHRTLLKGPYLFRSDEAFAKFNAPGSDTPARIYLPMLSLFFYDTLSFLFISFLLPIFMVGDVFMRWKGRRALIDGRLWTLIVIAGYGIAVSTMIDLGENMRFRLAFEPILIAVTWGVMRASFLTLSRLRESLPGSARGQRASEARFDPL